MAWVLGAGRPAGVAAAQWPVVRRGGGFNAQAVFIVIAALMLGLLAGLLTAMGGGYVAVLLVIALALGVAGLVDYRIAVFALMLVFPLTSTYFFPRKLLGVTGLNPFNAIFLLTLASFALYRLFARRAALAPLPSIAIFWPLVVALVGATAIGTRSVHLVPAFYHLNADIFSTKPEYVRDVLIKPLLTLIFVFLIGAGVARSRRMVPWVWASLAGGSALAVLILIFVVLSGVSLGAMSQATARTFLSPTGLHANELGVALVPVFTVALFLIPAVRGVRARAAAIGFATLALVAVALTFSRAAFLAVLLVSAIFAVRRRRADLVLLTLLVVAAGVLLAPDAIKNRALLGLDSLWSGPSVSSADPLTAGRVNGIWVPLWPDAQAHAVFGNGIHSTMWSAAARSGWVLATHPHNAYLQLLMDYGFVFGSLVVLFLWRVWQLWHRLARSPDVDPVLRGFFEGISVAFIAFLVQCMSGSSLVLELVHAMYLAALGVALGVQARLGSARATGAGAAQLRSFGSGLAR